MAGSDRIKRIFFEALELPADEREAFLEQACDGDRDLQARVQGLIDADLRAEEAFGPKSGPVALPFDGAQAAPRSPASGAQATGGELGAGDRVGPFLLEEELGSGGFGVVFRATQAKPVRRQVALKIVKRGMDSRSVIERFELERQALALMDHPNIARVFDAGETESGRPYFAMELVDGPPITAYCEQRGLELDARVRLFACAARAVQHAHQRGVLHRDIKPSNVLVAEVDGEAQPKVIDFGIAKATGQSLTDASLHTREGYLLGTPTYMSPEQVDGARDIDTRTDVYSLGVLLYELISGAPPFDVEEMGVAEVLQTIREQDPPRPSTRRSRASRKRGGARPVAPERELTVPDELDWIVMRCLEKERDRRYASAQDLAADAERFLADEPLEAAPPSRWYRARKLVRRHRAATLGAAGVVLALLLGTLGTTLGLVRAERSNARLDEALAQATRANEELDVTLEEMEHTNAELDASLAETESANRKLDLALVEARRQSAIAEAVNDFLIQDLLGSARPTGESGKGPAMPIGELLDIAARELEAASQPGGRFADEPSVSASLHYTLGTTFDTLGKFTEAAHHMQRCVELRSANGADADSILALSYLGMIRRRQGSFEEALELQVEAYELSQQVLGAASVDSLRAAARLASAMREVGRSEEAMELLEEALPLARASQDEPSAVPGDRTAVVTDIAASLAILYADAGRFEESAELYGEALETQIALLGAQSPVVLNSKMNIATLYRASERFEDSEALYREVIEVQRVVEGPEHPHTITTLLNLTQCLRQMERFEEALEILEEHSSAVERAYGRDHPRTMMWLSDHGAVLVELGKREDAALLLEEVLERTSALYGPEDARTLAAAAALDALALE